MQALVSLILPTRGRPKLATRFLHSALDNAEDPSRVEVVIYADEDDPESHSLGCPGLRCEVIVGPRDTMGALNSACYERSHGDIIMLCNDDIVIRTKGWDRRLREVNGLVTDGVYLAYPNDLFKGRKLCTFPILSRSTCEVLGEPFPRAYQGAFIDYHLLDIFKRLKKHGHKRLIYLEDVVFEHMHYRTGKGVFDSTYQRRGRFEDDNTFFVLRNVRSRTARVLLQRLDPDVRLAGQEDSTDAPCPRKVLPGRVFDFASALFSDHELPLLWRFFLFVWFTGRTLAAKGLLPGSLR